MKLTETQIKAYLGTRSLSFTPLKTHLDENQVFGVFLLYVLVIFLCFEN